MELVQEIHQLLMDREETCHRTCFSLQLNGNTLDNFAELKSIEGLTDGVTLKVVEEPYTVREARIHVRHVRDLLKSVDSSDAYCGQDGASLAFLNNVCANDIENKSRLNKATNSNGSPLSNIRNSGEHIDCTPPDFILPGSQDRPILPLHIATNLANKDKDKMACLKVLTTSAWNPPPGQRRMHGDLMYIFVITLEDKRVHITASPRGFYVNQTTEEVFNPKPVSQVS